MPRDIITLRRGRGYFTPAPPSISFVQITKGSWGVGVASFAASFDGGITAGSIIVLTANMQTPGGITVTASNDKGDAVTDSGLGLVSASGPGSALFCKAFLAATAGARTVTLTFTGGSPTFGGLALYEVAGLTAKTFDKFVNATGTGSATDSGSTGVLNSANEAAFCYSTAGGFSNTTPGAGWLVGQGSRVGSNTGDGEFGTSADIVEHRIVSSTVAINGTSTLTGSATYTNICTTIQ